MDEFVFQIILSFIVAIRVFVRSRSDTALEAIFDFSCSAGAVTQDGQNRFLLRGAG
jgi:hypothetical protein